MRVGAKALHEIAAIGFGGALAATRCYLDAGWAWVKALLRPERDTLWLLIAVSVANVVLAVSRLGLTVKVR